ncbi:MAG: hypothetical protein IJ505_05090 [Succinivibrio sp.]|nr:hypothetical protein [Succinivibrio sp.]
MSKQDLNKHWSLQKEKVGGLIGLKLLLLLYRIGGKRLLLPILYLVIFCYYLSSRKQRQYSKEFFNLVNRKLQKLGQPCQKFSVFKHFLSFADMVIDKFLAWMGKIDFDKETCFIGDSDHQIHRLTNRGKIYLCSHLGNIDALRAMDYKRQFSTINAVVFTQNAKHVNSLLKNLAPQANFNLIATETIGPDTAILLKEKIDKGEIVAIVGDRVPVVTNGVNKHRVVKATFLDTPCNFAQGPFILSSLLKCEVQLLFGLKNPKTHLLDIYCENFANPITLSRTNREADLQKYIQQYANRLEYYTLKYPYQWFNFFDFFHQ